MLYCSKQKSEKKNQRSTLKKASELVLLLLTKTKTIENCFAEKLKAEIKLQN